MQNLIELGGRLVRSPDDCQHQPLRCEAARALRDAHYEIERLQAEVDTQGAANLTAVVEPLKAKIEELQAAHELSRQFFLTHEAAGSCLTADGGQGLVDVPAQVRVDCEEATTAFLAYWRAAEVKGE